MSIGVYSRNTLKCKIQFKRMTKDITGKKFKKLRAIRFIKNLKFKHYWLFKCDCGKEKILNKGDVINGHTKSCGCLQKEFYELIKIRSKNPIRILNRFWSKVEKTDYCWNWKSCKVNNYGLFYNGIKNVLAHRFSYKLVFGKFPNKLDVLHKCDNPPCVNPEHLFLGTAKDNILDMIEKKRQKILKGEKNGKSKLLANQVIQIKKAYKAGVLQRELAKQYKICESAISHIITKRNWKHLIQN